MKSTDSPSLPVIDLSSFTSGTDHDQRRNVGRDLVDACHRTGFVYISNHGIPQTRVDEAFAWSKKFFELPVDSKMQAKRNENAKNFRGYNALGEQQVPRWLSVRGGDPSLKGNSPDYSEAFDFGSDKNKDEPNIWIPDTTLPGFREFFADFYDDCWRTTQDVLRALALGLGYDNEELLLKDHSDKTCQFSLRHYPSVPGSELKSNEIARLGAHADLSSITLLFQDDCGGLEVEDPEKQGNFMPVAPIKNTLVMNIGDTLMRWSNDYLKSTIHRVQPPPLEDRYTGEKQMTRERFSIPYFVTLPSSTKLVCLPGCSSEENPYKYPIRTVEEFRADFMKGVYT